MRFSLGLDLGQRRDPAALVIVESIGAHRGVERAGSGQIHVRFAERFPLGTPYPVVVEAVRDAVQHPELAGQCTLTVDTTGVGGPVTDMLRRANLGCSLLAVCITGSGRETYDGSQYNVPRTDLISGLQLLFEQSRIRIAQHMPGQGQLVRELLNMRMPAMGAYEHDDLVFALALACWRARKRPVGEQTGRLF